MPSPIDYALLLLAGVVAGVINTLAGGGSFITLPALMLLGLSPAVANGTNRIAVLLQTAVATRQFHVAGCIDYVWVRRLALPSIAGSCAGAWVATRLDPARFEAAFGAVMIVMGLLAFIKPYVIRRRVDRPRVPASLVSLAFLVIGFFGGFIQAGVGILLLSGMLLLLGLNPVQANSIKLVLALLLTVPALLIFGLSGQVEVVPGLVLSMGNATGAWLGVRLALRVPSWLVLALVALMASVTGVALLL